MVTQVEEDWVILDQTICYPLGGGQPGDSGTMQTPDGRTIAIIDTRKGEAGQIRHQLEAEHGVAVGDSVEISLDWERRHQHMSMHTALHLLGSLVHFGVTGGNISAAKGRLDFDMEEGVDKEALTVGEGGRHGVHQCAQYGVVAKKVLLAQQCHVERHLPRYDGPAVFLRACHVGILPGNGSPNCLTGI